MLAANGRLQRGGGGPGSHPRERQCFRREDDRQDMKRRAPYVCQVLNPERMPGSMMQGQLAESYLQRGTSSNQEGAEDVERW
jgi:hypothetical protein